MDRFDNKNVDLDALKKKAFNLRWAEVEDGVIPLTAADPDYPIAPEIKKAMAEYIEDGYFSYAPKTGLPEFRKAMSKALKERKGEEIDESLILPVDSAARAMAIIAEAFLKPGDEMIVFDPCDFLFREACLRAGGTPVSFPVPLDSVNRKMDLSALEDYVTDKTKMIGLCNPHNPYGLTYTKEEIGYMDQGYCSDWGRTVYYGKAPELVKKGYEALQAAECYMVFCSEPKMFFPNEGYMRVEDMILVTEDGAEFLTNFPRDLFEI